MFVERVSKRVNVSAIKRAYDRVPPNMILVRLGTSGATGMKVRRYFFYTLNAYFRRKQRVGATKHCVGIHRPDGLEIGDLPVRVHAGVRAARARYGHFMIQEFFERSFELALNGW